VSRHAETPVTTGNSRKFEELLDATEPSWTAPLPSTSEMLQRAQVTAVGRLAAVRDGAIYDGVRTVVYQFDIERVIAGTLPAGTNDVYVVASTSLQATGAALDRVAPKQLRALLFLESYTARSSGSSTTSCVIRSPTSRS
jgi:hypothetical protein